MSPILFSIFINQLLDEIEKAGIGITVKKDVKIRVLCLLTNLDYGSAGVL